MKDINKMLSNSYNVYTKNPNLSLAFEDLNLLPKRCEEFLRLLKIQAEYPVLQNALDEIVLTDEVVKVQIMNYSEDVEKQLTGVNEKDFLSRNLQYMKTTSSTQSEYITRLEGTVKRVESMISALTKCKSDLVRLDNAINAIGDKYNYVMDTVEQKKLYGKEALRYIKSVLSNRIENQPETRESIKETKEGIGELLEIYNNIKANINREIEIVTDLIKLSNKSENCKLLEKE